MICCLTKFNIWNIPHFTCLNLYFTCSFKVSWFDVSDTEYLINTKNLFKVKKKNIKMTSLDVILVIWSVTLIIFSISWCYYSLTLDIKLLATWCLEGTICLLPSVGIPAHVGLLHWNHIALVRKLLRLPAFVISSRWWFSMETLNHLLKSDLYTLVNGNLS